jgi:hypothetical protein
MNLALEVLFILLVAADTILTYKILSKRKGVEKKYWTIFGLKIPTLMGFVIQYPIFAVCITTVGVLVILLMVNESGFFLILIPVDLFFCWVLWRNWKIWRSK